MRAQSLLRVLVFATFWRRSLAELVLSLGLETAPGFTQLPPCASAACVVAVSGFFGNCQSNDPPVTYVNCLCSHDYTAIVSSIAYEIETGLTDAYPSCGSSEISSASSVFSNFCSVNIAAVTSGSVITSAISTSSVAIPGSSPTSSQASPTSHSTLSSTGNPTTTGVGLSTSESSADSTITNPTSTLSTSTPQPSASSDSFWTEAGGIGTIVGVILATIIGAAAVFYARKAYRDSIHSSSSEHLELNQRHDSPNRSHNLFP